MTQLIQYIVLGLGTGAVYALSAIGLVLIYRGSGVLNFAQGAVGMVAAFIYSSLTSHYGWPKGLALPFSLLVGASIGLVIYGLVLRRLRRASGLTRVIATIGVLVFLESAVVYIESGNVRIVPSILSSSTVTIAGATVPTDRLILLGIAFVLTVILFLVYRFTTFGLATTAVADDEVGFSGLGRSPDVIAAINWGAGGFLAALAAILIAPTVGLDPVGLTLIVVPAMAAALVGGFSSFLVTFVAGLAIGVVQSVVTSKTTFAGVSTAVPFVAIIGLMVLRGRALPARGEIGARLPRLGLGKVNYRQLVPVCVVSVLAIWLLPASWSGFIATSLIYSLVLLSLVVVTGFAGQISLAQYMLAGVAGWGAASLVGFYHWPIGFALLAGFVGTIGVGVGIGLPALRTRGVNLAIITLGFAATIEAMILENGALTGGAEGTTVGNFNLFGMDFSSLFHPQRFATLAFGVFVVCLIAVANLRRSQAGLQLIALRSNEKAAASLGIGVARLKLYAFGVAAGIAAISGMLTTFRYTYTSYGAFSSLSSIAAVGNGVIAGIGYVTGPVFGLLLSPDGIGYRPFESIPNVDNLLIAFGGLLLIVMLVVNPDGLASTHNLASFRRLRIWRSDPGRERAEDQIGAVVAEPIEMRARPSELEVRELSVRFGGVAALEHVNLVVKAGEIHGLIGPNGAGKTTFIDAVTGFVRASEGDIILGGESLSGYAAHRRVEKGLTRSFQNLELFEDLTVAENLRAGIPLSPVKLVSGFAWPKVPPLTPGAAASVRDFGIGKYLNHKPDQLPYGQRRLVAIARAVSTLPSIMLLDEPSSGLDEQDRDRLATLLQHEIREWGIGVLLVEHDIDLVQTVCDVVTVLDRGRVIACGPPAQVLGDPAVVTAYLGGQTVAELTGQQEEIGVQQ